MTDLTASCVATLLSVFNLEREVRVHTYNLSKKYGVVDFMDKENYVSIELKTSFADLKYSKFGKNLVVGYFNYIAVPQFLTKAAIKELGKSRFWGLLEIRDDDSVVVIQTPSMYFIEPLTNESQFAYYDEKDLKFNEFRVFFGGLKENYYIPEVA